MTNQDDLNLKKPLRANARNLTRDVFRTGTSSSAEVQTRRWSVLKPPCPARKTPV